MGGGCHSQSYIQYIWRMKDAETWKHPARMTDADGERVHM